MTKDAFEKKYPFVSHDNYGVCFYKLYSTSIRSGKTHIGYYKSRGYAQSKNNQYQDQVLIGYNEKHQEIYRREYYAK